MKRNTLSVIGRAITHGTIVLLLYGCGRSDVPSDEVDIGNGHAMHRKDVEAYASERKVSFEEAKRILGEGAAMHDAADEIRKDPDKYGVSH